MSEGCEGCGGYFDSEDTEQPILCHGCLMRLQEADIIAYEKKYLVLMTQSVLECLEKGQIGEAKGRLKFGLYFVKSLEEVRR